MWDFLIFDLFVVLINGYISFICFVGKIRELNVILKIGIRFIDDVTTYQMRKYLETWLLFKIIRSDHPHRQFKNQFYPVSVTATYVQEFI